MAHDLSRRDVVAGIPTDRDQLHPDATQDGLYLRVQRGAKSWAIRYTVDGVKRQKSLSLTHSYRQARDLARELRLEAKRGRDVVAERHEELANRVASDRDVTGDPRVVDIEARWSWWWLRWGC